MCGWILHLECQQNLDIDASNILWVKTAMKKGQQNADISLAVTVSPVSKTCFVKEMNIFNIPNNFNKDGFSTGWGMIYLLWNQNGIVRIYINIFKRYMWMTKPLGLDLCFLNRFGQRYIQSRMQICYYFLWL